MPAHCSYISGPCPYGDNPKECAKQSTVTCRNLRDRNEAKEKEDMSES